MKCKILLSSLFLFLVAFSGFTQTVVTIGTPASTSSTAGPTTSTSSGDRNERHTCIYSVAELTAAGFVSGNSIMSIGWEKTGVGYYFEPNLTIRIWLKETGSATFAANPSFATETGSATLVYQTTTGSIPQATGWLTFNFNTATPFYTWTGQNLQVITEIIRPASWISSTFTWRTITSVTNAAANASGTSGAPPATLTRTATRPQVRLGRSTAGDDAALIGMPSPVSGPAGSQNITVQLQNTGTTTLTSASIDYTINGGAPTNFPWSGSLVPGAVATVIIGNNAFINGYNTIVATVSAPNGGTDADPANNSITKTIETCSPLAGNYTIDKNAPSAGTNFNSFNAFASALTNCGVGGNVTATVVSGSGPYTEQVQFLNIPGLGAAATVTIQGNGETITTAGIIVSASSERATVRLKELSYFTINNLHVDMFPGSTAFMGIHLLNAGNHINVTNCVFNMGAGTSSLMGAFVASAHPTSLLDEGNYTDLNFSGNTSTGGGFGVSINGLTAGSATGITISNNTLNGTFSNAVYLQNTNGALVNGNNIHFASTNGIQLAQGGNINAIVRDNFISCTNPTVVSTILRGIYVFASTPGTPNKIINNVIRNMNAPLATVIGITNRTAGAEFYFNTIILDDETATGTRSMGFEEDLSNLGSLLRNNIFYITRGSSNYTAAINLFSTSTVTSTINSDYNVFYTANGAYVAAREASLATNPPTNIYATLTDWQTASGQDANSFLTDPLFQAGTAIPSSGVINGQGTPIAGITTDILGVTRSNPPDPGAYEFAPPAGDAAITGYILPTIPHCGATLDVKFELTNAGSDPLNTVTINWTVNGVPQTVVNWAGPSLASGASTVVTLGTIPVASATLYTFSATSSNPNGSPDVNPSNDNFTYTGFRKGFEGVLTINATAPVSVTNYQTFQTLADDLTRHGVCAAVTVNVSNGPYTEQVVFNAIPGTSSTNTVTLNGNNQVLQYNPTLATDDHILQLNGVNHMIVENLTVNSLHPTQGRGIHITNGASKLAIRNNTVNVSLTNSTSIAFGIIISGDNWLLDGSLSDSVVITGNTVSGGYSGIQLSGVHWTQPLTRITVSDNTVLDWYGFGVYLSYTNNALVSSNIIRRPNRTNSGSDAVTPAGITIPAGSLGFKLDKNRIYDLHLAMPGTPTISRGVYLSGTSIAPTSGTIQNNLIYGMTNDGAQYGIQDNSVSGPINIFHNTIVLNSPNGASTSNTNAINMSNFSTQFGTDIRNNIFVVTRGGTGIKRIIDVSAASSNFVSNYNVTWLDAPGGTQTYGQLGSTNYNTLADWQTGTGKDLNSISADPAFVSPPTGNFTPGNFLVDGTIMGTSSVGVPDDILGTPRSANPDAGAFEFSPPPCSGANGGTITATPTALCSSGSAALAATGFSTGLGTTYQWQYSIDNFGIDIHDLPGATNPTGASTGTISLTTYYRLKVTCATGPVTGYSNIVSVQVNEPVLITTQPVGQVACTGTSVTFVVVANNATSYQWQKDAVNIPGATTSSYTISSVTAGDAGSYRVIINGVAPCGPVTSNAAVLTVQQSVSITTQPVSQSVCAGSPVSFVVSATGAGLSYQWRKGGINIPGATSATYSIASVIAGDAGVYDVIVTGSCGPVTSSPATLTVNSAGSWIGVTSTNWNTASNWCGGIPTSTTDVIIPSTAPNMPDLSGGTGAAHHITINTGGSLTVGAGGVLSIYGDLVNNGTFNASAGSLAFRGASVQSIAGFTTTQVTQDGAGGIVLTGNATVTGTLLLTNGNITLGSNSLSLAASANGSTGSHIITNGTGNVVVMNLAASTSRTVPVGINAGSYNPVILAANAGHVTDNFTVNVKQGVFINGVAGATYTDHVVDRTWNINEGSAGGSNINITLQWAGNQELSGFQRNRSYIMRHNGAAWIPGPATGASGSDPFTQTLNGVTAFSPFAVRTEPIPRPVTGIYPNPAVNELNVVLDLPSDMAVVFSVYDAKGSLVMRSQVNVMGGVSRTPLNIERLSSGVYVLKLSTSANPEFLVQRFIKTL